MFVIKLERMLLFKLLLIKFSSILVNLAVIDQNFEVIWNVPTSMCRQHGIKFPNLTQDYGIKQNDNDLFRGNVLNILYDPGKFPALLENSSGGLVKRNGGIPQSGNLTEHLQVYRDHLAQLIPDRLFKGYAIIDFESWRPIFRQNFGTLQPYKELSIKLERERHWFWSEKQLEREAAKQWNHAAPAYMRETLRISQTMFPHAKWGYYGFPYCFNNDGGRECSNEVKQENNKIRWLWDNVDAIYPSVYLSEKLAVNKRAGLVGGRVREAKRMSQIVIQSIKPKIYTYLRYCYTDTRKFLTENDWFNSIKEMRREGSNGLIIWGSSSDLNTKAKCQKFKSYLEDTLGPIVISVQEPRYIVGDISSSDKRK